MANSESTVQIIPYYAHPHVFTVIKDHTWYEETVATPVDPNDLPFATAIVTGADRGIDNTFVRINKKDVKDAIFGKADFRKYGQPSLQADVLFNGKTNVWFCRVLPDNATYANIVFLMHYRRGKILDDLGQETGKFRLEVKFSVAYANKPYLVEGAKGDDDIRAFAESLATERYNPQSGYMTVPICYVRSIGRGRYGNNYSISISRDSDREKEFDLKMYKFNLLDNTISTRVTNIFSGSLYQTTRYQMSTLISDVLDQFSTGSCPVHIYSFEDNFQKVYEFYKEKVVAPNVRYIQQSGSIPSDVEEAQYALGITEDTFDPLFGYKLNTRTNEQIPYYRNYTMKATGKFETPDLVVPNTKGAKRPVNLSDWTAAKVGSRVLVAADPLNDGYRWLYTIIAIDPDTGTLVYDEGFEVAIDEDQYDGINLSTSVGFMMDGGHDGDFQEITVNGESRAPSPAEMKLLLSREYVKAWRGEKDRKILSPARVNIDFLFDANYNMTNDEQLVVSDATTGLYSNSTILTDADNQKLAILGGKSSTVLDFQDLNVKKAMYDLNEFRNRNGMTVNLEQGAGQSLYLDCGLVGLKSVGINYELIDIINMMEDFDGRGCSIDLGYYEIFDPISSKRIQVTIDYFIAQNLVPHIMKEGFNKPFTYNYATMRSLQRDAALTVSGNFIRDSFRPDIDEIDWDVKEKLYKSRINYWLTTDEGRVVQRAVQNTRQREASCLLEENNVRVLNTLKKGLEKACRSYHYEWNDPTARKGYTDSQMEVYRPWIGTIVEDLDIVFEANEFEQKRMMMHCYCVVKFRDIVKRVILEINIERPDYNTGTGGEQ